MLRVPLTILGPPVPKQRPRVNRRTGRVYTPARTLRYERHVAGVANAARMTMGRQRAKFVGERVRVRLEVYFPDLRARDVDNVAKSVLDGIVKGRLLDDDRQVDELVVRRHLDRKRPRVEVIMETLR